MKFIRYFIIMLSACCICFSAELPIPDNIVQCRALDMPPDTTTHVSVRAFIEGFYDGTCKCLIADTINVRLANRGTNYSKNLLLDELGYTEAVFAGILPGYYYLVLEHRNSIRTWSGDSMYIGTGCTEIEYDFTTAAEKAFGANMTIKNGKYCTYSGDVNQDGCVDFSDLVLIDVDAFNFVTGYVATDVNGDSVVDYTDVAIAENNALNYVYEIAPF